MTTVVTLPPMLALTEDVVTLADIYRLSVEQYHAMADAGILMDGEPVELLEGWLVKKMTKNNRHIASTGLITDELTAILPAGWFINSEAPVATGASEPEPDIAVVRGRRRDYLKRRAGPQDIALVIEVADSSLERDRKLKLRIYARARYPIYWIVNLVEQVIEVYSAPSGPTRGSDYEERQAYRPGDEIPVILDGQEVGRVAVSDLLP